MKKITAILAAAAILAVPSCEDFFGTGKKSEKGNGAPLTSLRWSFSGAGLTRATYDIPDTNDFVLSITGPGGSILYNGPYGASPEILPVSPGTYTLKVVSTDASLPAFDTPVYGDEEIVIVKEGEDVAVRFDCSLINSGIRLRVTPDFTAAYPGGQLFVSGDGGSLPYGFREERTAFFNPGIVSLELAMGDKRETVFSRALYAGEILSLKVSAGSQSSSGDSQSSPGKSSSIQLDTSAVYLDDECVIGEVSAEAGSSIEKAMGLAEAKASVGRTGVWVRGFIVGGDLSSGSSMKTEPPFSKDTHFAIASRSSTTDKASCMAVELKKGSIRDALNLVSNPSLLRRDIFIKGDIVESYFSIPGIKNVTEYSLKE
ncbi:MAG: DUF4493 domain-containing protein [Bacteroidales bacterium]|nr:DUF4493 domain-containing protein [Bacteroidales bacterium]